jgi:hypothetical protein
VRFPLFASGITFRWINELAADIPVTFGDGLRATLPSTMLECIGEATTAIETSKKSRLQRDFAGYTIDLGFQRPIRDAAKAEACFQRALTVGRQQQARSWELRAAMSMARLWRDQGKRNQARELLAPIYGWFTEGFDTLDLKEATALLEELAA